MPFLPLPLGEGGPTGPGEGAIALKDWASKARDMRRNETRAEQQAWGLLRNRRFRGLKFRRQHAIGRYTVDFYCFEHRFAVELDGSVHSQPSQTRKDKVKDDFLESVGVRVLRVSNGWVLQNPDGFLAKIAALIPSPVPLCGTPSPLGRGQGKRPG